MSDLRIGGLATGMDIDQIVKDLMRAHRMKVERIRQKRQLVEWQRTDYRTINNSLRTLRDMVFNMKLKGPYLAKNAASSNEFVVAATAGVSAAPGSYTVTVDWLAQGVTRGSQSRLAEESNSDGTIKTLNQQFTTLPAGNITFTLVGKIGTDGVTRNSHDFTIDTTTATVNTLVSEINNYSDTLGITASYDAANNRFFLTTNGTGSEYGIGVSSDSDSLLSSATGNAADSKLQLAIQTGAAATAGQDAQFSFGDAAGMTSHTNTVTINGITLSFKDAGTSTVTVSRDTDAVYNSIKSFIDQYNTTIDLINKELKEERYKDYLPLTDEEREKLSDKQEEEWEEKAKSGMLRNDSYLTGLLGKMRSAMGGVVSGITSVIMDGKTVTHNSLASIGIITGDYSEGGKLYLKNGGADLKAAIQADPDGVMKLFNNDSTVAEEKGLAARLYDEVDKGVDDIIEKAGAESTFSLRDDSVLGKKLYDLDKQVNTWEERLIQIEDRYWRQFTALEKAISQMNAQSAWLAQQFGAGQ
ncbi:MAG: flagellar filament capping protein FliD [Bacillota bacterium]